MVTRSNVPRTPQQRDPRTARAIGRIGSATFPSNLVWCTPATTVGAPLFRTIVAADLGSGTPTARTALDGTLHWSTIPTILGNESANTFLAGPTSGGAALSTFRAIVAADLGSGTANANTILAGNLAWQSVFTTIGNVAANTVLAGPTSGGAANSVFRTLVAADIPAISLTAGVSGVLPIANGGTNLSSVGASGSILNSNGSVIQYSSPASLGLMTSVFTQVQIQSGDTVANSLGAGFASEGTIPANSVNVGFVYDLWSAGVFSTTGTPTMALQVFIGATKILDTGLQTMPNNASNVGWNIKARLIVYVTGASGTLEAQGEAMIGSTIYPMSNASGFTVDFTANQALDVEVVWGTASSSNTITQRQYSLSRIP